MGHLRSTSQIGQRTTVTSLARFENSNLGFSQTFDPKAIDCSGQRTLMAINQSDSIAGYVTLMQRAPKASAHQVFIDLT